MPRFCVFIDAWRGASLAQRARRNCQKFAISCVLREGRPVYFHIPCLLLTVLLQAVALPLALFVHKYFVDFNKLSINLYTKAAICFHLSVDRVRRAAPAQNQELNQASSCLCLVSVSVVVCPKVKEPSFDMLFMPLLNLIEIKIRNAFMKCCWMSC